MSYLGQRDADAVLDPTNPMLAGGWTAKFTPQMLAIKDQFEVFHIALRGPAQPSCTFQVWLDTTFYTYFVRGDINDWDPNQAMPVRPGQTLYVYWNSTTAPAVGTAPHVTIFCREPAPF